jgi:hypothetical protein
MVPTPKMTEEVSIFILSGFSKSFFGTSSDEETTYCKMKLRELQTE